jgi:outer membrane protein OmpA-like peptidoglycan-associated protein
MRQLRIAVAVLAAVSIPLSAVAQDAVVDRSFDVQLFEPALGNDVYLSVEGPQVLGHLAFGVGMMMNYAHKPLVLYKVTKAGAVTSGGNVIDEGKSINVVENQMTADLVGAMGFHFKWLHAQVGLDLPINLVVSGTDVDEQGNKSGDLSASGIGDLRLQLKAMILRDFHGLSVAFSPIFTFPTGKDDGFGGDPNLSFRPRAVVGYRWRDLSFAANLGYLLRENSRIFSSEIADQLLYGIGASYKAHSRVVVLAELFGRAAFSTESGCRFDTSAGKTVCDGSSGNDLDAYPLETDIGARVRVMHGLSATAGVGFGLIKAIGSPQVRVLGGVVWSPDFTDSDGDGLYDHDDKCPTEPEDKDGFRDGDGCPDPDNDEDLIPDVRDKCPNEAEDKDTYQDDDGCPDTDNDGDGIPDIKDSCPFKPETKNGFKDDDGCPDVPDQDEDGIADTDDKCPKQPEDKDGFNDLDGCPDPDNDGDEVPDNFDDCPLQPEDMDKFKDDDGCPDPDNDGDGVLDADDKCPDKPETINGYRDEDGCPDRGKAQVIIEKNKITITKKVYFATAKAKIKRRSFNILNQVALVLRANPQVKGVRVEGHTDSRGNAERNKVLSQKRAEAVRDYLIKQGIEASRLYAVGYGPDRPIADNKTRKGRADNRRVEFVILEQAPGQAAQPQPAQ